MLDHAAHFILKFSHITFIIPLVAAGAIFHRRDLYAKALCFVFVAMIFNIAFSLCFCHFTFHENSRKLANRYGKSEVKTLYIAQTVVPGSTASSFGNWLCFSQRTYARCDSVLRIHNIQS
jgi:hypothetical protein